MAENVAITAGSGTTIATDEVTVNATTVQVQRVKSGWGADNSYNDPAVATPLPVQVTLDASQMSNLGTILTPKFASVSVSSSGDNSIVAADATHKIRVLAYVLVADAAVAAKWRNATTDVTGPMAFAANGGVAAPFSPVGHFETAANAALNLNLASAVGVRGHVVYVLI